MDSAWCVPLLAAVATFLLTMPFTCFGLLFVLIMEKFGTTREQASWVESAFIMSSNLSALAIAFLQRRISLSHIALMAAAATSASVVASAFAPDVIWLSIVFGGAYGFAVKVFMASASIYTMLFFDKYRATAQSFISCAQGAAGMAGQTLLSRLERTYGLAGALVILGGILMHAVPLSMLLKEAHRIRFTSFLKKKASAFVANIVATSEITCSKKGVLLRSVHQVNSCKIQGGPQRKPEFAFVRRTSRKIFSIELPCLDEKQSLPAPIKQEYSMENSLSNSSSAVSKNMLISQEAQKISTAISALEQNIPRDETITPNQSRSLQIVLSLLKERAFYVLVFAIVVGDYTEIVFLATAVEYGQDMNLSMEASGQIVTLWFLGQFLGSGLLPVIADNLSYSRSSFYVVTFAISSVSLVVLPHMTDIGGLALLLAIHGMAMGFIRCVKCVVIADQVGTERTAACWGISGLAIMPLSLASPEIIGYFRDSGGSYDNFYRMLGGINFLVTLQFALFLACRNRRKTAIEINNP
ncbi:monocarboxylate transporter 9 isoform X1 [Rhipicephalus sanguineus]|uniref:monocarboxylate transporter 9 isoform X1 n=1 Tax=Rhipicephalus sanguineus TaxID=34632 RepID=UPI001892E432|nr:monocarboxylate transporter 9 isoform X1 [Rhipicephalus sanguineus]